MPNATSNETLLAQLETKPYALVLTDPETISLLFALSSHFQVRQPAMAGADAALSETAFATNLYHQLYGNREWPLILHLESGRPVARYFGESAHVTAALVLALTNYRIVMPAVNRIELTRI